MDKRIPSLKEKQKTREHKKTTIEKKKTKQLQHREGRPYSCRMGINGDHAAQEFQHHLQTQRMRLYHCPKTTITSYLIWKHLERVISFAGCSEAKE